MKRIVRQAAVRMLGPDLASSAIAAYIDYRTALTYRVTSEGRRSSRRLASLRDAYRGQRCFIIGNGPSLREMDLSPLEHEWTFGLNRIYIAFDRLGFSTTFLVVINQLVAEQFGRELAATTPEKFVSWHSRRFVPDRERVTFIRPTRGPRFLEDVRKGFWGGATVTYAAMQLAFHMGFTEAVLIGVDHSFSTTGPAHDRVVSTGADLNHFDPSYFGPGVRWELPNLEVSELAYRLARKHWEAAGRRIVDATVGGQLRVFPKADFKSLL